MRIIAGTHRHRTIKGPPDERTTRPITDRVKQSLFDRLWSLGMLGGGVAADVFAGTGSLGLEALSRGIEHVTFIERDRLIRRILEENLATLVMSKQASVLSADALAGAWINLLPRRPINLVFLDPPYAMTAEGDDAARVAELIAMLAPAVAPGGLLVLRTNDHAKPRAAAGWDAPVTHEYGSMAVHFYHRAAEAAGV